MEVKDETVDPEYKPCPYEKSNQNCMDVMTSSESITCGDVLNSSIQDQLRSHILSAKDPSPPSMITESNLIEHTEMSHILPKRIAQTQQRLHPDLSKRLTLAQPKDNEANKTSLCYKWKNGSPIVQKPKQISNIESNQMRDNSVSREKHYKDINTPKQSNNLSDSHETVKTSDSLGYRDLEIGNEENPPPMEGLFGWTLIDDTYIPYIFRADNKKYVCVRLLEYKVLKKYPNVFPEELAIREPLTSSFIKPTECKVFNQLVRMQYRNQSDIPVFNQEDVVVLLSEFMSFYSVVKKIFPECTEHIPKVPKAVPKNKSGWLQINNTIIPYICRSNVKLLPLAVLKHAASIVISSYGIPPSEEECRELNNCCAKEGFKFTFKVTSRLVSLDDIKKTSDIQVFELPEKDPLQHAKYLSKDEGSSEGLKINTQETALPLNHGYHQLPPQDNLIRQTHIEGFGGIHNPNLLGQPVTFAYSKDPSNMQNGSPNVTIVSQPRMPQHIEQTNTNPRFPNAYVPGMQHMLYHNRMPISRNNRYPIRPKRFTRQELCSFNLERPMNMTQMAHPHGYGQPVIPRTFLNVLPSGQNINVNYGINIQNITPNNQAAKPPMTNINPNNQTAKPPIANIAPNNQTWKPPITNIAPNNQTAKPLITSSQRVQKEVHSPQSRGGGSSNSVSAHGERCHNVPDDAHIMSPLSTFPTEHMVTNSNSNNIQPIPTAHNNQSVIKVEHSQPMNLHEKSGFEINNSISEETAVRSNQETNYHMKQKQAIQDIKSGIKGIWLGGKNISCLHVNKPGRSGRFCLVEAICKLYYRNRTVSEFLFTIEKVLETMTCTELEEQAFIDYYQLPVSVLKCNKMVELTAFEKVFPQLMSILADNNPQSHNPSNVRYPQMEKERRGSHQREQHVHRVGQANHENKVIVLDN